MQKARPEKGAGLLPFHDGPATGVSKKGRFLAEAPLLITSIGSA